MNDLNIYTIAFLFKGKYYFTKINANSFANYVAIKIEGDGMLGASCEYEQEFRFEFLDDKNIPYIATFSNSSPEFLNVYETNGKEFDDREYDDWLIEENIPYFILKVENKNKIIYNINDEI